MKSIVTVFLVFAIYGAYGQSNKQLSDQDRLNQCIAKNTTTFTFNGEAPSGEGWEVMANLFKENQFVAWGEYHNSPLLSQLTAYALAIASTNGYRSLCVETSPFVATELMRIAHSAAPADTLARLFKSGYPEIGTLPFFKSKEDAAILTAVKKYNYKIWGIDQEFQMSFSYCMSKIYDAQPKKIKHRFRAVLDSLQAKWWYPKTKLLDSLKNGISQKNLKAAIEDIKISKEIYRTNDNEGRAALMKKNFFNYYHQNDKVFFKLGSNHLAKGINLQTNVYDIGNAIYELAQRNQATFANVYIMARYTTDKGKVVDDLYSYENENPKIFSKLYDKDRWVLVDISKLRTALTYDNTLSKDTYGLLEKYDFVLVSPETMR